MTKRQREALEWVGDGKTMQDTAMLMGLTVATVEKHLLLARDTLAVDTTAQAVFKASFSNQMFVLEAQGYLFSSGGIDINVLSLCMREDLHFSLLA